MSSLGGGPIVAIVVDRPAPARPRASCSAYVHTPPTASAVISTRDISAFNPARSSGARWSNGRVFEALQRQRPIVLNVAEPLVSREVIAQGALPRSIVGRTPPSGVVGGARIRKQ